MCGEGPVRSGQVCTSGAVWARVAAQLREASLSVGGRAGVQSTLPPCVYARCAGGVLCTHNARSCELSQISSQVKRAACVRRVCGCSPSLVFKNTVGMPCGCIGPSRYRTGMHTRECEYIQYRHARGTLMSACSACACIAHTPYRQIEERICSEKLHADAHAKCSTSLECRYCWCSAKNADPLLWRGEAHVRLARARPHVLVGHA